jgi:hypothetical protein
MLPRHQRFGKPEKRRWCIVSYMAGSPKDAGPATPSLRANGSRERAPDDRLREAIHNHEKRLDCFVASLLAMTVKLI